jgi:hypothetical protein
MVTFAIGRRFDREAERILEQKISAGRISPGNAARTVQAQRTAPRVNIFFPSGGFFGAGQSGRGVLLLLLQASLIFWPMAVRIARAQADHAGTQRMLDELARSHQPALGMSGAPAKRFRPRNVAGE